MEDKFNAKGDPGPLTIDHVPDFRRRYPGETVTFYTRVSVRQPLPGFTLRVAIPAGLVLGDYRGPPGVGDSLPIVEYEGDVSRLHWTLTRELPAGTSWEYQVQAQVAPTYRDMTLESRAVVFSKVTEAERVSAEETTSIVVMARGQYLRYLPALYREDELIGRFVMLFESFWKPIEGQIDNVALYLDPWMTPREFLPWLASWLNLVLDDRLSEERKRWLIQSALSLYRRRGTREGLQDYLEIYTGQRAQFIEHRGNDFRLGPGTRLGPGIALGKGNRPHTFTVIMRLPPIPESAGDDNERARLESERRRMIEAIIEAEKPAHTDYTLRIENESPPQRRRERRGEEGNQAAGTRP
jgi:phage tail-like protein